MIKRVLTPLVILAILAGGAFLGFKLLRKSPEERLKIADEFFANEQFDSARIEYMNVLREDPANTHALQQVAYSWVEQGSPFAALRYLHATVERAPGNLEARGKLAATWFSLGQIRKAREEALAILDEDPANEDAVLLLAKTSFGEDSIAEATERVAKFNPEQSALSRLANAILARRRGEPETFKTELEDALALDPKSPDIQLAWAGYQTLQGNPSEAREALRIASEQSPPRSGGPLNYAAHLANLGETDAAMAVLKATREAAPDYFPALVQLADLHRREKQYPEAMELLERVLGSDSTNPSAFQTKAQVFLDQGDADRAIETLEQLDARVGLPLTKFQLARLHLARNEVSEARTKLNEALGLNPDYADAILVLAQIELRTGAQDQAAGRLEKLLKSQPNLVQAELVLAQAYQLQGRLDDVAAIYSRQVKANPQNPGAHFALGRTLFLQQKFAEARLSLQEALRLQPDNLTFLTELVGLNLTQRDFESAHALARPLIDQDKTGEVLFLEARIYAAEAKWNEARAVVLKALDINPNSIPFYSLLVGTYLAEQKPGEAIAELEALLEKNPDSLRHRMLLALLLEQSKDYAKAAASYEEMLKQQPEFAPALNNLAYLYSEQIEDLDRAEPLAKKAHELAKEAPAIADTYGWILFKKSKYAESLPLLEQAAEQYSENREIHYHLGMARLKMGLREEARTALTFAVDGSGSFPGKEVAERELAALSDPSRTLDAQSVEQLQARVQLNPKDAAVRLQLAQLQEMQGAFAKSAEAYEAVNKINPRLPEAWMGLARLYGGPLEKLDQGIEAGRMAHRLNDTNPEAAALLGRLALKRSAKGDLPWAYGMLWEASRKLDSPQVLHDYARAAYLNGKISEARTAMERLVKAASSDPLAKSAEQFLALTDPGEQGWKSLAPLAENRLKEDPQDVPALMVRAHLEPAQAVDICEKLLSRFPDFVYAKIRLAGLLARSPERVKDAEGLVRELLATHSADPELIMVRGAIAVRKKDPKTAIQLLEKCRESSPLDSEGLFYLGTALLDDGRSEQGAKTLREALQAGLDPTLENEARATLGLK